VSDALVKVDKDPVDLLRQKYERLQEKDLHIARTMDRFAELPSFVEEVARQELIKLLNDGSDAEIEAKYGFKSKRELRIAMYGTLPKKDWPAAMQSAHERVLARTRKQVKDPARNVFNLNIISIPAPKPIGPENKVVIIDAKAEELK
jgi:hypothetical protein